MSLLLAARATVATPPPWSPADLSNHENRNTIIYAVFGICVTFATVFLSIRIYTRLFIIRKIGLEDYLIIASWVFSLVFMIMVPLGIPAGIGSHEWNVTLKQAGELQEKLNIAEIIYEPAICLAKLAILVQILHIFAPTRGFRLYWIIKVYMLLTTMFYFSCVIFRSLACIPWAKLRDPSIPGTCINSKAAVLASAIFNVISDFILLCLPINSVWQLQMPKRRKWGISAVFATGLFGCVASIMRLDASVVFLQSPDFTFQVASVGLWANAEMTCGIICCSLPVFPQFYKHHCASVVSSITSFTLRSQSTGEFINLRAASKTHASVEPKAGERQLSETEQFYRI